MKVLTLFKHIVYVFLLIGDQPQLSEQEIQKKLHDMKSIPSIFDIETHKPGESPIKPAPNKGQSPSIR